ncbi:MAG: alanine racemase [Bacteroidales bacterium]|nr:alanine racemase [Bacteroidales bacterium]MCF8343700.1 alanine racemase [Bacteroidales bacterium]MCF8352341.1 alanine racemase [Bacteroidales bacterium]MCF8377371.1 alanine racemase [Bacteroidales bacterium]MCF8401368.1 alanine racemase [Bacteroidales bacterium]
MINKPTLLLDEAKCRRNIRRMAQKARKHKLIFRPHLKTHQSHEVGRWLRKEGVDKITVSSVDMARYFADDGWEDLTIAFPLNILEMDEINELASRIRLNLLVESTESAKFLAEKLKHPAGVFIKIDAGYQRTGLPAEDITAIGKVLKELSEAEKILFKGFIVHSGNTYYAGSKEEVRNIHQESINKLQKLKDHFVQDHPDHILSIGDTPSCSMMDDFNGIDEIRPGNFVFYDVMQYQLGTCRAEDIAVALLCPVVAKHPGRREVVIYGGAVHLSKDSVQDEGKKIFGLLAPFDGNTWGTPYKNTLVRSLSQEHGIIRMEHPAFDEIGIGDLLAVLPVHSCLTLSAMRSLTTTTGKRLGVMLAV